jgi:ATP-binding cassette subfamily B protein
VKPRRSLRPLWALSRFALRYKGRIVAAFVALVVANLATLAIPIALRTIIDFGFEAGSGHTIDRHFVNVVLVAAVLASASAARYYLVVSLSERMVADLRAAVFRRLVDLSPAFFDAAKAGELVSRLTGDTVQIRTAFGLSASIALRNLLLFLGATIMMVVTSPQLSAMVLLVLPVVVLPLVAFGRRVQKQSRRAQDTLADVSAHAAEMIGAMRVVQAFTAEEQTRTRFEGGVEGSYRAIVLSSRSRAILMSVVIFLVFTAFAIVLWIGAHDVVAGRLSRGTLSQFVFFAVLSAAGLSEVGQVWSEMNQAAGAAERLEEILKEEPAISAPAHPVALPQPPVGTIRLSAVSFAYPSRPERQVIDRLSLEVKPGETVAIVGPSGAGKSTLFHLLLRYYDPQEGAIAIDGVDLIAADPREVRSRIALVPQDALVFGTTAAENIRFGRPEASDAEVEDAARQAAADDFIRALPQGYETQIGERGVMLSGGQRQRIAIARAVLRSAPILLLDEATSALDSESEKLVQKALEHLMKGRTTLVIAHRLATVLAADRILVLDQGKVVDDGPHELLVKRGGLYAKLAYLQFGKGDMV